MIEPEPLIHRVPPHPVPSKPVNGSKASTAAKEWKDKIKGRKLKKEEREQVAKVRIDEMERLGREASLNKSLVAYLEMCVFTEQINRGLNTLNYYRSRSKVSSQYPAVTDVAAYNILLQGFAVKVGLTLGVIV